ncbi:MAG: ATP-binding protein [Actinomycetota bacterium]
MVQPPRKRQDPPADPVSGSNPTRLPARRNVDLPTELPAEPAGRPAMGRQVRARRHAIREVAVVQVAARLNDGVQELDRAIQLALAEGPRGVVCDLPGVREDAVAAAVEVLATAGRHVRDWPGVPVAVACPDPLVREALEAHPLGAHLIVRASLSAAVAAVQATPAFTVEWLQLAPHPTAPRASREFVTRTLLDWRLGRTIPFATLVVSELVASSSVNAGTDIDLSVAWNLGSLRLTVRDRGPGLPGQEHSDPHLRGRGLTVVAGLSRSFGVMPTADGGKVVWAVLEAPRPYAPDPRIRSGREGATLEPPVFTDGLGLADLPFCAASGPFRLKEVTPSTEQPVPIPRRPADGTRR